MTPEQETLVPIINSTIKTINDLIILANRVGLMVKISQPYHTTIGARPPCIVEYRVMTPDTLARFGTEPLGPIPGIAASSPDRRPE